MKNEFEIRGEVTAIFLRRKDGSRLETLIDTDDLGIASSISGTWNAHWKRHVQSYYAVSSGLRSEGRARKRDFIILHRLIMGFPSGMDIDHVYHDTLDNRRSKLAIVSRSANCLNRKCLCGRPSGGARGIWWDGLRNKWRACVTFQRKAHYFGDFKVKEEAEAAARAGLNQLYGELT